MNENPVAQIDVDEIEQVDESDEKVDDVNNEANVESGNQEYNDNDESEEIDERFVDALSENYYYDYENQEIKTKNSTRKSSEDFEDEAESVEASDESEETEEATTIPPRSRTKKNRNSSRPGRRPKANERSDKIDENENALVFAKSIPPKVKKILDSSVKPDRKRKVKVATARGEEANRSVS